MTDIEQKALALVNEVGDPQGFAPYTGLPKSDVTKALCLAIEHHEAFRQEVSDAVEHYLEQWTHSTPTREIFTCQFGDFIITKPKPDPLVEAMHDCGVDRFESWADQLRAALEARGLEIREKVQ